ncbi:3-oxoacyl-[acyl-carrier-protein] synthase III C-terminal domain-containing protein [Photorhabdus khanii]|uniref:3-oxoacyl-ACP synthase n=1 Tax=Photorhabdus khanii subsp. guanajuatensis TaxID=2100166 RepID=A0A4R4J2R4_9GAMM|nr:3-oxoacyl-[acyl-carrier-protein] synthase III C-terminal domain-containing protein [Photorhabdus khanii]TDB47763.1 3-oxoacyl-ACP synthase [Photorhabdus khanii subsp. guanajuatensis]
MKIAGIAGSLPSRFVTNKEVIDLVEYYSKESFQGDLSKTLKMIGRLFDKCGIESRYWLANGEKPMELMEDAFYRALAQANINKEDIDLLIYPSVTRGFTEPANSTFISKALGLSCRNFDVIDACNGWVAAMDIINSKMKAGEIRYAAIVNMEFGMSQNGPIFPRSYSMHSSSELAYKFPSFTIGEATTVTIISNESPDNFKLTYISRPDLSDLSTISLPDWQQFCNDADIERIAPMGGKYQFSSYSAPLHDIGIKEAVNVFNQHTVSKDDIDHVFIHTGSPKMWAHGGQLVGVADKIHHIGQRVGNIITASIPFGIIDAIDQGILEREQLCMGWAGSGGMVFAAMTFNF